MFPILFILMFAPVSVSIDADSLVFVQYEDETEARRLAVEGRYREAIQLLESQSETENLGREGAALLISLYHQHYRYPEILSVWSQYGDQLQEDSNSAFYHAHALLRSGYAGAAVSELQSLTDRTGEIRAAMLLAQIYYDEDQWEKALPLFETLSAELADNLMIRTRFARALRMADDTARAKQELIDVLGKESTFLPAILELIQLHINMGEPEAAQNLANRGLWHHPEEPRLWNFAGRIAYNKQQFQKAIEKWENALKYSEPNDILLRNIGLCYYQIGLSDEALKYFEQSLSINPVNTITLMYTAMSWRQKREWEKALSVLDRLYDLYADYQFTQTLMQRAVVREELGKLEGAMDDYTLVEWLDPENSSARFYKAALIDRSGNDKEKALEYYQDYLEREDLDPELENYAKGRISVLREQLHFERGRQ